MWACEKYRYRQAMVTDKWGSLTKADWFPGWSSERYQLIYMSLVTAAFEVRTDESTLPMFSENWRIIMGILKPLLLCLMLIVHVFQGNGISEDSPDISVY